MVFRWKVNFSSFSIINSSLETSLWMSKQKFVFINILEGAVIYIISEFLNKPKHHSFYFLHFALDLTRGVKHYFCFPVFTYPACAFPVKLLIFRITDIHVWFLFILEVFFVLNNNSRNSWDFLKKWHVGHRGLQIKAAAFTSLPLAHASTSKHCRMDEGHGGKTFLKSSVCFRGGTTFRRRIRPRIVFCRSADAKFLMYKLLQFKNITIYSTVFGFKLHVFDYNSLITNANDVTAALSHQKWQQRHFFLL